MAERSMAAAELVRFRGGGFEPGLRRGAAWLVLALILAAWQAASSSGLLPALVMPSPLQVLHAFADMWRSGRLTIDLEASLSRVAWGWTIGTAAGLAAGIAMGIWSSARSVGIPVVSALFPIPKIALLPLLILWFGIGEPSKVATIALGVFFPTVITGYSSVDAVPRNLIRMAQSFNVPRHAIIRKILLPGAMPGILAGFRISSSIALILLVAAEMIGAEHGVGAFILQAGNLMQTDQLVAGVVVLSVLGLAISYLLGRLERALLRWG
ncbi:MAG: ABC transporter permease [Betaproteobacteria bacterium]|nr:ABC transporter permease [Betaproteobacteria bacterium]